MFSFSADLGDCEALFLSPGRSRLSEAPLTSEADLLPEALRESSLSCVSFRLWFSTVCFHLLIKFSITLSL